MAILPFFLAQYRPQISGIDYLDPPPEINQSEFPGQNFVRHIDKSSPAHALQGIRVYRFLFQEFGLIVVCFAGSHRVLLSWRRLGLLLVSYNIVF